MVDNFGLLCQCVEVTHFPILLGKNPIFTPVLAVADCWVDCIDNLHEQSVCKFRQCTLFVPEVFL